MIDIFSELAQQQQQSDSRASDTHLSGSSTSSCTSATSEHEDVGPQVLPAPSVADSSAEQPPAASIDEEPINLVLRMR